MPQDAVPQDTGPDAPDPLEGGEQPGTESEAPGGAVVGRGGRSPEGDADVAGDADLGGGAPGTDEDPLRTETAGAEGAS